MADAFECLIWFFGMAVCGWKAVEHRPDAARKVTRTFPLVAAALVGWLTVTGFVVTDSPVPTSHRGAANVLTVQLWLCVPFAIGGLFQGAVRYGVWRTAIQFLILLMVLGLGFLTAFTGYLGPTHTGPVGEETRNRFEVLHKYALPGLLTALLAEWWWFFRPRNRRKADDVTAA
jgi:hypothetical protein